MLLKQMNRGAFVQFTRRYSISLVVILISFSWLSGCVSSWFAQDTIDNQNDSIKLTATTETNPPQITLNWITTDGPFQVHRKVVGQATWGDPIEVGEERSYVDATVESGVLYEYMVRRRDRSTHKGNIHVDRAFVMTGVSLPPVEDRGSLLLIVEQSVAQELTAEIKQLQSDLVGDGWRVFIQNVSRTASPIEVKSLIRDLYNADPEQLKSVYLLGHVPIPYSGDHGEDGHGRRAWPADIYYGDMDGDWTDSRVNRRLVNNPNVPQDGVFDPIAIDDKASNQLLAPELAVGRVDFHDMPLFAPLTEVDLLRRYLQKAHQWRHGEHALPPRGLIFDRLGQYHNSRRGGENAWQNLTPLVGVEAISADGLTSTLSSDGYLWAYGISTGGYTAIHGGFSSRDFRSIDPPVAFYNLFGSYFGDWDTTDNLLRATLAAPTYGLASVWGNWGRWHFHHMALGSTIGESMQATHDPSRGYHFYEYNHRTMVEMNLLGDPTLRLHPMHSVSDVIATQIETDQVETGQVEITWTASREAEGYFIYRKGPEETNFTRLNQYPLQESIYLDDSSQNNPEQTNHTQYMIRAARNEITPSGTYTNLSVGVLSVQR